MPRDDREVTAANQDIQNIANGISGNMDALYRSTYISSPQHGKELKDLNDKINSNIDRIISKNMDTVGLPSISKLYERIQSSPSKGGDQFLHDLESMFDNGLMTDDLYGMFMSNRYLKELDNEIDTVCRYMPELEEALAVQKDCVLSADHFSKDFLNFINPANTVDSDSFNDRSKDIKKKYDLPRLIEEIYDDTSKYGEKFVYRVPYATAIGKLLATKPDGSIIAPAAGGLHESYGEDNSTDVYIFSIADNKSRFINESGELGVFTESIASTNTLSSNNSENTDAPLSLGNKDKFSIGVEICKSGIIESVVKQYDQAIKKLNVYSAHSMAHEHTVLTEKANNKDIKATGGLTLGGHELDSRMIANDGLVGGEKPKPVDVKIPGCVIHKLEREQVVPIYIEDICMGYYYFELRTIDNSESFMGFKNILGDPLTNMRNGDHRTAFNTVDNQRQDDTIRYVAGQLSKFIDKQFVNNNQDLAKEIYMILKSNDLFNTPSIDTIKVTFIPPEDMVHFFFKQDPVTHRGISDLEKGLIPAKIYSSLYITDAIGKMTRGQDKRVYYVKQSVDTNIAKTLLTTISQIKQSNFGIRQFQNINNILNITGRFNDFVIPTNASGEPPINFEIMPGQRIETPTDLMDTLKEAAVNSTGIPIEMVQMRNSVDYAMQLTMSSSKVLRFVYKRQELFQDLLSRFVTPIYNYEYNDSIDIKVTLPPPSFINITNTNQLVDNTRTFVQSIVEVELANEQDDALKNAYTKKLFDHYIGTHIDISAHKDLLDSAKLELAKNSNEVHANSPVEEY